MRATYLALSFARECVRVVRLCRPAHFKKFHAWDYVGSMWYLT